MEGTYHCNW